MLYVPIFSHSDKPLALIITHRSASQMSSRERKKARTDDNKGWLADDSVVGKFGVVTSGLKRLDFGSQLNTGFSQSIKVDFYGVFYPNWYDFQCLMLKSCNFIKWQNTWHQDGTVTDTISTIKKKKKMLVFPVVWIDFMLLWDSGSNRKGRQRKRITCHKLTKGGIRLVA